MSDRAEPSQRIVEQIQEGVSVEESFRRLCELWDGPLYRFFSRRGFSHADCLELTQETFLGIYRGIGSFRRDARFETWLFTVATNAWRKHLRRGAADKRAGTEVALEGSADGDEPAREIADPGAVDPGEEPLRKERRRLLRQAIEKLPEQMRKCLILRVYHDLKYREIGAVLKLSPETVKAHLAQARRRLQEELGDYFREVSEPGDTAS
jgi:RNA polymerase sigma-70 factor (ECF subfamily)